MGRIDEALKQAQQDAPVRPSGEGSEIFHDPWDFSAAAAQPERAADPETLAVAGAAAPSDTATAIQFRHRRLSPDVAERLITAPNAPSQLVEQYRRLAAIVHHAQQINGIRILLVTSALPGDGKTLTSSNLALTLSES